MKRFHVRNGDLFLGRGANGRRLWTRSPQLASTFKGRRALADALAFGGRGFELGTTRVQCLGCERAFDSPDAKRVRLCSKCKRRR